MNDGRIENMLRDAEPSLPRGAPDAAAVLAARVRERAAARTRSRSWMVGVVATVGILATSGVVAVPAGRPVLWSVGPDTVDQGGREIDTRPATRDLVYIPPPIPAEHRR